MKRISSFLLCLIAFFLFSGCNKLTEVKLEGSIEIPESGIIEASDIKKLQGENAVGKFCGASNGFKYEWTVFGNKIKKASSVNLKLEIKDDEGLISCEFSSKENIDIPFSISIYLKEKINLDNAYAYSGNELLCEATVTGKEKSIINLSPSVTTGRLVIYAEKLNAENNEADSSDFADNNSVKQESKADGSVSDGTATSNDKYNTEPVPEGKPLPSEPQDKTVDSLKEYTCYFMIECSSILNNLDELASEKLEILPENGIILKKTEVKFKAGESVFDVLKKLCKEKNIHLEYTFTIDYNSDYIEGIGNIYANDCGQLSGWMYKVNDWYPNYGCSRYILRDGDAVVFRYTCDLGRDIGNEYMGAS